MSTKKIGVTATSNATTVCKALDTKFPQFKFTVVDGQVVAEGPWERKAVAGPDGRPAMGDMTRWAEGYDQALTVIDDAPIGR